MPNELYMRPYEGQCLTKFKTICENDLVGLIKEFGIKTSEEDPIPAMLLKFSKYILLPMYVELTNKSLSEGNMELRLGGAEEVYPEWVMRAVHPGWTAQERL